MFKLSERKSKHNQKKNPFDKRKIHAHNIIDISQYTLLNFVEWDYKNITKRNITKYAYI